MTEVYGKYLTGITMTNYTDLIANQLNKKYTSIKIKSIRSGDLIQRGNLCKKVINVAPFSKSETKVTFEDNEMRVWSNSDWAAKFESK
jgi:hypothetical protein